MLNKATGARNLHEIYGVALITLALIVGVSVFWDAGLFGRYVALGLTWAVGLGRYLAPLLLLLLGVVIFRRSAEETLQSVTLGAAVLFISFVVGLHLRVDEAHSFSRGAVFSHGGLVGGVLALALRRLLGVAASYILLAGSAVAGLIFLTGMSLSGLLSRAAKVRIKPAPRPRAEARPAVGERKLTPTTGGFVTPAADKTVVIERSSAGGSQLTMELGAEDGTVEGYRTPPLNLLRRTAAKTSLAKKSERESISVLEQTLSDFGVEARVGRVVKGPTVTRFELQLASGVKVNRIVSLADDIALALASADIRVLAPIPGKSAVGIEVPNEYRELVTLGDILASDEGAAAPGVLTVAIGKDIAGQSVLASLGDMPHLLIAGTTGSGKSVCINAILMSLLLRARPDQVKLILIDPKRIELNLYNELPHLLVPVVINPKEAATALAWAVGEMENRFQLLAEAKVRNIDSYNVAVDTKLRDRERLPYIVVVVDELADLMMVAAGEVEDAICRLAQMARAVGIHLVVATQRPSTDIITGLIKANIPARIAFAVSSQIDSRVILDTGGAEKLVGKGDMLYQSPDSQRPRRLQGPFLTESEVEMVTGYIKKQARPDYRLEILEDKKSQFGVDYEDDLFDRALELVVTTGQASTSMLQRRLRVGYARAARLIDMLEQQGIVGALDGSKPRAVFMTQEELAERRAGE